MRNKKEQDRRYDQTVCIIIRKRAADDTCAQRQTVAPPPFIPHPADAGIEDDRAGHGRHGIRIDIGMQEKILRQEHNEKAEQPSRGAFLKQKNGQTADVNCHNDAEYNVYHARAQKERQILFCKKGNKAHEKALNDVGQDRLKGIGTAVAADRDLKFFAGRERAVTADELCNLIAVYFIGGSPNG